MLACQIPKLSQDESLKDFLMRIHTGDKKEGLKMYDILYD